MNYKIELDTEDLTMIISSYYNGRMATPRLRGGIYVTVEDDKVIVENIPEDSNELITDDIPWK